ncbi:MAG: hypothetical protein ABEH77_08910, partial [Halobacteriaceae archaeon]
GTVVVRVLAGGAPNPGGAMAAGLGLVHMLIAVGLRGMAKPAYLAFTAALLVEIIAGLAIWTTGTYTLFGLGLAAAWIPIYGYHVEQRRLYRV